MTKKLTVLILTLGLFYTAFAETFVVTSQANSGPGTLREAIQKAAANGTNETDYIYFNIPQTNFNDRIINLVTELPALTSKLVIDGTTQPGAFYGTTEAKICLKKDSYVPEFTMLQIDRASDIKILGLNLYYGYWEGFFSNTAYRSNELYGIKISNATNIEIGAPGKGNVLNGFVYAIYANSDSSRNIKVRSNYIGQHAFYQNDLSKDIDDFVLGVGSAITFYNVKDITIGGPDAAEGNVLGGSRALNIDSKYEKDNGFILIQNNYFYRWYDKKKLLDDSDDLWDGIITIGRSRNNGDWTGTHYMDYAVAILDNDIPKLMTITSLSEPFSIKRNKFETNGLTSHSTNKCLINYCPGGGIIGGEDLQDANIFRNKSPYQTPRDYGSLTVAESGPVTILKNIFECNTEFGTTTHVYNTTEDVIPYVQVHEATSDRVSGKATPNSVIHLYYDDECNACEGKRFITTVVADADSNWYYNGLIQGTVVATATNSKYTSAFSEPEFFENKLKITQPTCGLSNGSITGIETKGADAYFWINIGTNDTVSKTLDLLNAGPGTYHLFGVQGGTCIKPLDHSIKLEDQSPKIITDGVQVVQPSCGQFNGSVADVLVYNTHQASVTWRDQKVVPFSNPLLFTHLSPGTYHLIARDTIVGCADTAVFVLTNQGGPSLNFNNLMIAAANCSNPTGSIKNITASDVIGTPSIQWVDINNTVISHSLDLTNVPAGQYRLKFKDESTCDTIITPYYTIENIGAITIDTTTMKVTASNCPAPTGTITGIQVTGADSYQWTNAQGQTVSTLLNLGMLYPGRYILVVTNQHGCEKKTLAVTVPVKPHFDQNIGLRVEQKTPKCDSANGYLKVLNFPDAPQYTFRWVDSTQQNITLSTTTELKGFPSGLYFLYAKDHKGCEQRYVYASFAPVSAPQIDESLRKTENDVCEQGMGFIKNVKVTGGNAPFTYTWVNESNQVISHQPELSHLSKGAYTLMVEDKMGCKDTSTTFTILNQNQSLATPVYSSQTILKNTATTLVVSNYQPGIYQLFDTPRAITPLQENTTGIFHTDTLLTDKTFYIKLKTGSCESALTAVPIKVVNETKVYVPTAFSPNKDGKNDVLKPVAYGIFNLQEFSVFDRWGNKVFSTGISDKGWNGKNGSLEAPAGVYIWTLKGKDIKGNTISQKGTTTLIR